MTMKLPWVSRKEYDEECSLKTERYIELERARSTIERLEKKLTPPKPEKRYKILLEGSNIEISATKILDGGKSEYNEHNDRIIYVYTDNDERLIGTFYMVLGWHEL